MQAKVLLFASARDAAQSESIFVDIADDATAAEVLEAIGRELPQMVALLPSCRLAVDCCYLSADSPVDAGGEIALIPPVSGG